LTRYTWAGAVVGGINLHAAFAFDPRDKPRMERRCRYLARKLAESGSKSAPSGATFIGCARLTGLALVDARLHHFDPRQSIKTTAARAVPLGPAICVERRRPPRLGTLDACLWGWSRPCRWTTGSSERSPRGSRRRSTDERQTWSTTH
jgi:hypothetical protein